MTMRLCDKRGPAEPKYYSQLEVLWCAVNKRAADEANFAVALLVS
jgi:hypothetical protein